MANVELPSWVTILTDKVAEELSNTKMIKFNTHKNRKVFIDKINKIINQALEDNIPTFKSGRPTNMTSKIHDDKERGITVMSQGQSEKLDELREERLGKKVAPVRSW